MKTLFTECLEALLPSTVVLDHHHSLKKSDDIFKEFPLNKWGRIDWNLSKILFQSNDFKSVVLELDNRQLLNEQCFILWSDLSFQVITTTLNDVIKHIDDVTAVSFDTFIYLQEKQILIEFWHDGQVSIVSSAWSDLENGVLPKSRTSRII